MRSTDKEICLRRVKILNMDILIFMLLINIIILLLIN